MLYIGIRVYIFTAYAVAVGPVLFALSVAKEQKRVRLLEDGGIELTYILHHAPTCIEYIRMNDSLNVKKKRMKKNREKNRLAVDSRAPASVCSRTHIYLLIYTTVFKSDLSFRPCNWKPPLGIDGRCEIMPSPSRRFFFAFRFENAHERLMDV